MESIPEGLDFPEASTSHPSTSQAWLGLLARAHSSLDIASFYWTLTNNDTHTQEPSAQQVPGNPGPGGKHWGSGRHLGVGVQGVPVSFNGLDTGVWKQLSSHGPLDQGCLSPSSIGL